MLELGFSFDPMDDSWNFVYEIVKKHYDEKKNLIFKRNDKNNEAKVDLSAWVQNQKRNLKKGLYNKPKYQYRIKLLKEIEIE